MCSGFSELEISKLASRELCLVRVGVLARIFRLPTVDVKGL